MYACVFQDTNEAEAENTDKEGDFNLKVSRRFKLLVFFSIIFFIFCYFLLDIRKIAKKRKEKKICNIIQQVFLFTFFYYPWMILYDEKNLAYAV